VSSPTSFDLAIQNIQLVAKAFPDYKKTKVEKRLVFLETFLFSLVQKKMEIIERLVKEQKCSVATAELEFIESVDYLHFLKTRMSGYLEKRLPLGPALIYGSWSSPLLRFSEKVVTALSLGNTVLLHCAPEQTDIYGYFAQLARDSRLPEEALSVFGNLEAEAIELLYSHPALRTINFAGHPYEGEFLKKLTPDMRKKYKIHFGGRNPVVFLHDADLSDLEDLVKQALEFHYLGEMRFNRWFVQEKNYPEFTERLKEIFLRLSSEKYFSFPSETYRQHFLNLVKELKTDKNWQQETEDSPFLSADFNNCSPWQQQEVLGPILTVTRFKNSVEAIKFVNTTFYANAAAVFSGDNEKAQDLGQQLTMPLVTYNRLPQRYWERPLYSLFDCGWGCDIIDADFFTVPRVATVY
jgi:acyl-CoA reductase-like NAD-dependent aldehyde dehydrogenase